MPEEPGQQLEFLRREDIRTMAKDMARLREEESKKERERIVQIQGERGKPAAPELPKIPLMPAGEASKLSEFESIKKELPRPLSKTRKLLVRVVIALLLLFAAANIMALTYMLLKRRGV